MSESGRPVSEADRRAVIRLHTAGVTIREIARLRRLDPRTVAKIVLAA